MIGEFLKFLEAVAGSAPLLGGVLVWLLWDLFKFVVDRRDKRRVAKVDEAARLRDQLLQVNDQANKQIARTLEIIGDLTAKLNEAVNDYHALRKEMVQVLEAIDVCVRRFPETAPIFAHSVAGLKKWREKIQAGQA